MYHIEGIKPEEFILHTIRVVDPVLEREEPGEQEKKFIMDCLQESFDYAEETFTDMLKYLACKKPYVSHTARKLIDAILEEMGDGTLVRQHVPWYLSQPVPPTAIPVKMRWKKKKEKRPPRY